MKRESFQICLKLPFCAALLVAFFLFIAQSALAQALEPVVKPSPPSPNETPALKSDAIAERGFKDLFTANSYNVAGSYAAQINPQVMPFVQSYLRTHENRLMKMKGWALPYFNMMDGIMMQYGLPRELKYLAVIESNLQAYAISWAGAVGPWQFMPATGRRMGLRITHSVDDRTDYIRSTHAAARYLRELYSELGDWLLVIAAYNGGPGRVRTAIKRSGSTSFWRLQNYLPEESRMHVKKFISTHYIMEGTGGQTTSTAVEWANHQSNMAEAIKQEQAGLPEELTEGTASTEVQGKYNAAVVAAELQMDLAFFNKLNPGFEKIVSGDSGYSLRLPAEKMELFKANRYNILYQSILATMQQAKNRAGGK